MANKIWANFHGVYLVGMSMRSSSRRQSCIRSAMRLTILGESMLVFELRMSGSALRNALPHNDAALDQEAADLIDRARPLAHGARAHTMQGQRTAPGSDARRGPERQLAADVMGTRSAP